MQDYLVVNLNLKKNFPLSVEKVKKVEEKKVEIKDKIEDIIILVHGSLSSKKDL
jgi:hypothetical protein